MVDEAKRGEVVLVRRLAGLFCRGMSQMYLTTVWEAVGRFARDDGKRKDCVLCPPNKDFWNFGWTYSAGAGCDDTNTAIKDTLGLTVMLGCTAFIDSTLGLTVMVSSIPFNDKCLKHIVLFRSSLELRKKSPHCPSRVVKASHEVNGALDRNRHDAQSFLPGAVKRAKG